MDPLTPPLLPTEAQLDKHSEQPQHAKLSGEGLQRFRGCCGGVVDDVWRRYRVCGLDYATGWRWWSNRSASTATWRWR